MGRVGAVRCVRREAYVSDRLCVGAEESRRAAVYGLGAAGDAAVPGLVAALQGATAAHGSAVAGAVLPAVAHALGEAAREDTVAGSCELAATALVDTMKNLELRLLGRMGLFEGVGAQAIGRCF